MVIFLYLIYLFYPQTIFSKRNVVLGKKILSHITYTKIVSYPKKKCNTFFEKSWKFFYLFLDSSQILIPSTYSSSVTPDLTGNSSDSNLVVSFNLAFSAWGTSTLSL